MKYRRFYSACVDCIGRGVSWQWREETENKSLLFAGLLGVKVSCMGQMVGKTKCFLVDGENSVRRTPDVQMYVARSRAAISCYIRMRRKGIFCIQEDIRKYEQF